jgi:hypothetical protein
MPSWTRASTSDTAAHPKGKATIGTASAELLGANRKRLAAYITNRGANRVWLALGETAAKEEGILLNPEGGAAVIDDYTGAIAAIAEGAGNLVTFSEV